jgi:hypothetical protein
VSTPLSQAIIRRANADGLPENHELRSAAKAFDEVAEGFFAKLQTYTVSQFFKAWADTREAWCAYSGEPLL